MPTVIFVEEQNQIKEIRPEIAAYLENLKPALMDGHE